MKQKSGKNSLKVYIYYVIFGVAVTFSVTIFNMWVSQDIAKPYPLFIILGLLVGIAFKLFADLVKEDRKIGMKTPDDKSRIEGKSGENDLHTRRKNDNF